MVEPSREIVSTLCGPRAPRALGATTAALFAFASLATGCGDDGAVAATPPSSGSPSPQAESAIPPEEQAIPPEVTVAPPEVEVYEGPPRIRLLVIQEHELLGSETRGKERLVRGLTSAGFNVLLEESSAEEAEYARAWLAGTPEAALPEGWSGMHGVILLEAFPPVTLSNSRRGARVSGGIGSTLTLRPPSLEPMLEERAGRGSLRILRGSTADRWLGLFLPLMQAQFEEAP